MLAETLSPSSGDKALALVMSLALAIASGGPLPERVHQWSQAATRDERRALFIKIHAQKGIRDAYELERLWCAHEGLEPPEAPRSSSRRLAYSLAEDGAP